VVGALASTSIILGAHLLASRLKHPDLMRSTLRSSPLLIPFLTAAPICLGFSVANLVQNGRFEAFARTLEDRAAFGHALGTAARRAPGWVGEGAFDDERVRAWSERLVGHGQAGTIAPPKGARCSVEHSQVLMSVRRGALAVFGRCACRRRVGGGTCR
jgi:hypothetical protein